MVVMPNHWHFVVRPTTSDQVSELLSGLEKPVLSESLFDPIRNNILLLVNRVRQCHSSQALCCQISDR